MALVEQVMTMQPYASAKRVFWVVDNGSSHRGEAAIDRLAARFPNAVMVHTPVHASWLNQVEICFSVVQRKVVLPNDFTDLAEVKKRLAGFEKRYNQTARPFRWTFTRDDLHDLLARISQHEQQEARGTCAIVEMHPPVRQSDRTVGATLISSAADPTPTTGTSDKSQPGPASTDTTPPPTAFLT